MNGFAKYGSLFHVPLFIQGLKRTSYYKTTFYTLGAMKTKQPLQDEMLAPPSGAGPPVMGLPKKLDKSWGQDGPRLHCPVEYRVVSTPELRYNFALW